MQYAFVVMMYEFHTDELLASTAFKHHANYTGPKPFRRVGMMHECCTGESFTSAALKHHDDHMGRHDGELLSRSTFMHHDDQGHNRLKQYAAIKELISKHR